MITLPIYYLIVKRYKYSILDPVAVCLLISGICTSDVIYMYIRGMVSITLFLSFLFAEIFFIVGFNIVTPQKYNSNINKIDDENKMLFYRKWKSNLFYVSSIIYICTQLYSYKKIGIPFFMDSTNTFLLELNSGNGFIKRVLDGIFPIITYLSFDRIFSMKKINLLQKTYTMIVFIFIVITMSLSGYKSNFISLIFILQLFKVFTTNGNRNKIIEKKINKKIVFLSLISAVFIILIINYRYISHTNESSAFSYFLIRVVAFGDVYIYTYIGDVLGQLVISNPFIAIFSDILGMFRIVSREDIPNNLGLQIYQIATNTNYITGPNPRQNIFGLVYFGFYGGMLYSFVLGLIISLTRNRLINKVPSNFIGGIIFCTFVNQIALAPTDIASLCLGPLNSFIIFFSILLFLSYIITGAVNK